MSNWFRFVAAGVAIVLLCALSFSVGTTAGEPDPDELLTKAVESLESDSVEAIHTQEITRPDGHVIQTVAIHQRSSHYGYLEIIDSTDEHAGQQVMFDGSTVWRQNVESGSAIQYEESSDFWFDEFRTLGAAPEEVIGHYDGEYKKTSKIDGREAYVIDLQPQTEPTAGLSLDIDAGTVEYKVPLHEASKKQWYLSRETWWVDSETYYPIKQTVEWTNEDGDVIATATREYKELTLGSSDKAGSGTDAGKTVLEWDSGDADIQSKKRFFQNDTEPQSSSTETTSAAEKARVNPVRATQSDLLEPDVFKTRHSVDSFVPFDLPTLDIPDEYSFDRATVQTRHEGHHVMLFYEERETGATLSIQLSSGPFSMFERVGKTIHEEELEDIDGKIAVTDSGTQVVRQCEDVTFWVRGPPIAETLIDVTKSADC